MSHASQLEVWQIQRDPWKARLVEIGDMRPGSLVERFRPSGKPTCHCAQKDSPGHGPCYSLTRPIAGKTVTPIIPKEAADERQDLEPADHLPVPPTLYLGIDGTGIPWRAEELDGRVGKQPEGSAKTREVKLCTVGSAASRDPHGTPVRDEGAVTYSAAIESAATPDTAPQRSEFSERVWREATRRRFPQAERRGVLADGAPWIWNLTQELFPEALQIVHRFHAKEHLSNLAQTLYGPADPRAPTWAKRRPQELDTGRFHALLAALRRHGSTCQEARRALNYFQTNRHRMRYPDFHAQGLCTSTGGVEAGGKVALGTRLKRAGMHWTLRGSNPTIALRCCKLSARFQDFWERRSTRRAA